MSLFKTKQLDNTLNVLILCLSISDWLVIGPGEVLDMMLILKPDASCTVRIMAQFYSFFSGHTSGLLTVAIGVHRLVYMHGSHTISPNICKVKLCIYCFGSVTVALAIAAAYTMASIYGYYHIVNIAISSLDLLPFNICFLSYLYLYRRVVRHVKNNHNLRCTSDLGQQRRTRMHSVSMTHIINRIIITLYICYTPHIIISLVLSLRPTICTQSHANLMAIFLLTAHLLLRVNSVMNAIIFLLGNRKSRQLILEVFQRACNRTAIKII